MNEERQSSENNKVQQDTTQSVRKFVKKPMERLPKKPYVFLIYLALVAATFIAFEQVRHNEFISYDDYDYVTGKPQVTGGITRESVVWAFTTAHGGTSYWHPLTSLSHMLDCELFGLNPYRHHLVNLFFHIANTLLLFWVLKKMTGAVWASGFVAVVFALHPLHVESVAWVSERKDMLNGFFWMLTIAAYVRYAERPSVKRYLLVFLAFCLGLMSKPMFVSLPFVLLLLDYWPLRRFQWSRPGGEEVLQQSESAGANGRGVSVFGLVAEKVPLFVLVAALGVVTYIAQQQAGAMALPEDRLPLDIRIVNAPISYLTYIGKMLWPSRLAILYPHPGRNVSMAKATVCGMLFLLMTYCFIKQGRRRRYLAVGWLWYLGILVPVIGLVQVGSQAMADRYTYLSLIGLFIIVAWGVNELAAKWPHRRVVLGIPVGLLLVALFICTRVQVKYWRNDFTLYEHAIAVTGDNPIMHYALGYAFKSEDNLDEAIDQYREAVRIKPDFIEAHNGLGVALKAQGKIDEAISHYRQALKFAPDVADTHNNLGSALKLQGKLDEAISHYRRAIEIESEFIEAHNNLGNALVSQGKFDEAMDCYRQALEIDPDCPGPLNGLARILVVHPDLKQRDVNRAIELAERAAELTAYENASILETLAAAYVSAGRFDRAVATAQTALELALASQDEKMAGYLRRQLELYKQASSQEPGQEQDATGP